MTVSLRLSLLSLVLCLCRANFASSYISIYHERNKDDFKSSSIDTSYAIIENWSVGFSFSKAQSGDEETERSELNSSYTVSEKWLDVRGAIRKSEEPSDLEGKGLNAGFIFQVSQLWKSRLATNIVFDFYYTEYSQEASASILNYTVVFTRDLKQKDFSFVIEQEINRDFVLGIEHGFSRYDDASLLTGTSSRFQILNFTSTVSGINGYPDYRWGGYLQYYFNRWLSFEVNYSDVESKEVELSTTNLGVFATLSLNKHIDIEPSYFKIKTDSVFEIYGLRFSYSF